MQLQSLAAGRSSVVRRSGARISSSLLPLLSAAVVVLLALVVPPPAAAYQLNYHNYDSLQMTLQANRLTPAVNLTYTAAVYGNSIVNPPGLSGATKEVVLAYPDPLACSDLRGPDGIARTVDGRTYEGKIMLILRGACTFGAKSLWAELAGADIALVYSCSQLSQCDEARVVMYSGALNVSIPTVMVNWADGNMMQNLLQQGANCPPPLPPTPTTGDEGEGAAGAMAMLASSSSHSPLASSLSAASLSAASAASNCSLFMFIPGTGGIHPDDRAALTSIGRDLNFSTLVDRSSQSGPLPPFSFITDPEWDPCIHRVAGVWCQGYPFGRVVVLDLDSMNISGILSPAFGELVELQQLTLSSNSFLCEYVPCSFGNLTNLRVLNVFHVGLKGLHPPGETCLKALVKLQCLDASFNSITQLAPAMMEWTGLLALDLEANGVASHLTPAVFALFTQLQFLNIRNNLILLDVAGLRFSRLRNLAYLYAGTNFFEGTLEPDAFDDMFNLREVDLSQNGLSGPLPRFSGTNLVTHLDLSNNLFTGNVSGWVMPQLLYLALGQNMLSDQQRDMPMSMPVLQYLDLSNNLLTVPLRYSDVGEFLFDTMPLSLQTVHLEFNQLAGSWGPGFLQSFPFLSHVFLSFNQLSAVPSDVFDIGGGALESLDLSYNDLFGSLSAVGPSPVTTMLLFQGNPQLRDPFGALPEWAVVDPTGPQFVAQDGGLYVCSSLKGTAYHLVVQLDPSYHDYSHCACIRGTYGAPPHCKNIPSTTMELTGLAGTGSFTDGLFGSDRSFPGVDTNWLLGVHNLSSTPGHAVHDGSFRSSFSSAFGSSSDIHLPPVPPAPGVLVRAIYVSVRLNLTEFAGGDDSLTFYTGGSDLSGTRVALFRGDQPSGFVGNIPVGEMWGPGIVVTILGSTGTVNFRSRHAEGTHFHANFTLSSDCPPGYLIRVTDRFYAPEGSCVLPPGPSSNGTIILLLVTSVIIGVLALCLLAQKMSAIQGLINGSAISTHPNMGDAEQAQELYGPVLSVEETWRLQLKRDVAKEALMLALEVASYVANWVVVVQEVRTHYGPVMDDSFLVGYCIIVVTSTVSGFVSVFVRVRVMREIYRELHEGVAVVPTIDRLLHHIKRRTEKAAEQSEIEQSVAATAGSGAGVGASTRPRHESFSRIVRDSGSSDDDLSLPPKTRGAAMLGFGRPLLADTPPERDETLLSGSLGREGSYVLASADEHSFPPTAASTTNRPFDSPSSVRGFDGRSRNVPTGRNSPALSNPYSSAGGAENSGEDSLSQLQVGLSSKDPNVQLAWVQRTISTTKLTSLNLLFSTLPFLVLNQVRIFMNNNIRGDWTLQLSSLFATVLLGVKLIRIFALGELLQRRNELVFEVVAGGSSKQQPVAFAGRDFPSGTGSMQMPTLALSSHSPQLRGMPTHSLAGSVHHTSSLSLHASGLHRPPSPPNVVDSHFQLLVDDSSSPLSAASPLDPQCPLAPATSFASPSALDLFAPSASFANVETLADDKFSGWARENQGSSLQLQADSSLHAAAAGSGGRTVSTSSNSSNGAVADSRTVSSDGWISAHMASDNARDRSLRLPSK